MYAFTSAVRPFSPIDSGRAICERPPARLSSATTARPYPFSRMYLNTGSLGSLQPFVLTHDLKLVILPPKAASRSSNGMSDHCCKYKGLPYTRYGWTLPLVAPTRKIGRLDQFLNRTISASSVSAASTSVS